MTKKEPSLNLYKKKQRKYSGLGAVAEVF